MLLDTSGLLCLRDRTDGHHSPAVAAYLAAHARLTHSYILAEFVALAHVRRMPRPDALALVIDLAEDPDVELTWVDEHLHREAVDLLLARPDKTYSLCDAVSFVLMRRVKIMDALTKDRHFEQEGFRRLLV